ncbi:MAG: biotin--[acetyl-CoA-carboxylase] ligase [Kiritimatiellia bacterium]
MNPSHCRIIPCQGLWNGRLLLFDSLPSTNDWVLSNAPSCRHGDVVRALRQTAGRGRFQREWITPAENCLTVTAVLEESRISERSRSACGQAAAVAVAMTMKEYGLRPALKWPNDVTISGRKTAGILAEGQGGTGILAVGAGINVNLTRRALKGIEQRCTATSMLLEKGSVFDVDRVYNLLRGFLAQTMDKTISRGFSALKAFWEINDSLRAKYIRVSGPGAASAEGRYHGIDDLGRLLLAKKSGEVTAFWSGDVSVEAL